MIRRQYPAWARRRRRGAPDDATMEALATAMASGASDAVRAILHRNVVLTIDSGGFLPTASADLAGRVVVASALVTLMTSEASVARASINGDPGLVVTRDETVVAALTAETRSRMLSSIWVVCNPEKLRHWNR